MAPKLKIVSDGTAYGTKVYTESGEELKGMTKIEIHPIVPMGLVQATVTFLNVELELVADQRERRQFSEDEICKHFSVPR